MNIFEFSQALRRQRRLLWMGLVVVLVPVFLLSFTVSDGKPAFRIGPDYESTVQIAVAPADIESLAQADLSPDDLTLPTGLYAELIKSGALVDALELEGIHLEDDVDVQVAGDAPVISATFTAGTSSQARAASLAVFQWLEDRLSDQLVVADVRTTPTTVAVVDVSRPFDSRLNIVVATGLGSIPSDLFLLVDLGGGTEIAVPIARNAGSALEINTSLSPTLTVRLSLERGGTRRGQPIRVTPPEMPVFVDAVPALVMTIAESSVLQSEDGFGLSASGIALAWEQGEAFQSTGMGETRDVSLVLLTPEPSVTPIGARRGPILFIAAVTVGMLLLLALVISVDTWQQEKRAHKEAVAGESDLEAIKVIEPVAPDHPVATGSVGLSAAEANKLTRRPARAPVYPVETAHHASEFDSDDVTAS